LLSPLNASIGAAYGVTHELTISADRPELRSQCPSVSAFDCRIRRTITASSWRSGARC